jgi:hypothetical protein
LPMSILGCFKLETATGVQKVSGIKLFSISGRDQILIWVLQNTKSGQNDGVAQQGTPADAKKRRGWALPLARESA